MHSRLQLLDGSANCCYVHHCFNRKQVFLDELKNVFRGPMSSYLATVDSELIIKLQAFK